MGSSWRTAVQRSGWIIDWLLVPLVIVGVLYNPSFSDGDLFMAEAGQYLGSISSLLKGEVPYRDVFLLYGPLSVYVPALIMQIAPATLETLRAYFHLCSIATVIISYWLAVRLLRSRLFRLLAGLCLVFETYNVEWSSRWGALRHGMGLLILLTLSMSEDEKTTGKWLFVTGFLCGFALLYSTEIGVFSAFVSLVHMTARVHGRAERFKSLLELYFAYFLGLATCLVPFAVYFYYENALWEYLRIAFFEIPTNHLHKFSTIWPSRQYPEGSLLIQFYRWCRDAKMWLPAATYVVAAIWLCWACSVTPTWNSARLRILALLAYGIPLYATAFRAVQNVQFTASIAPSILLGMIFLEWLWFQAKRSALDQGTDFAARPFCRAAAQLVVVTVVSAYVVLNVNFGMVCRKVATFFPTASVAILGPEPKGDSVSRDMTFLNVPGAGNVRVPAQQAKEIESVVNYMKAKTLPGEPIFVFPDMGVYYFFIDRPSVTRFPVAVVAYMTDRYCEEIVQAISEKPPRYILYGKDPSGIAAAMGKDDEALIPELVQLIRGRYSEEDRFGNTSILRYVGHGSQVVTPTLLQSRGALDGFLRARSGWSRSAQELGGGSCEAVSERDAQSFGENNL